MKAVAVYPREKRFQTIADHPEPRIEAPGEVKLRMLEVGICGTDKEIVAFEYGDPPPGSDYLVIGHESLGEVVEAGPEAQGVAKGDLAVFTVRRPCPESCTACAVGRQDFCYTGDFTERGIKQRHGFMTEYVVDDAQYAHRVPPELRDVAVLTEPLTIAEKGVEQLWQVQQRLPWSCPVDAGGEAAAPPPAGRDRKGAVPSPGPAGWCHKALVLGAGPVGLLGAMKMVREGFQTYVYSRAEGDRRRREIVEAIGAIFINADTIPIADAINSIGEVDVVYEAVGAGNLAFEALGCIGPNAVFIFTGVPGRKTPMSVDTSALMKRMVLDNQMVFGTVNAGPESFKQALDDLGEFNRRWPGALRSIISNRIPIDRAAEPLSGRLPGIKNVISLA